MTKQEVIGSKILILNSGGAQIRRNISNVVLAFISSVSVVIVVKVKCLVDFFNVLRSIITNKTNVPTDLRSAGI